MKQVKEIGEDDIFNIVHVMRLLEKTLPDCSFGTFEDYKTIMEQNCVFLEHLQKFFTEDVTVLSKEYFSICFYFVFYY